MKIEKINVASREKCPAPGGHVFQPTGIILELVHDIIGMNLLTKKKVPPFNINGTNLLTNFHEDQKINVASRVLTRKNAPLPGGHVFQPTGIIFELFHEDWTINVVSRVHVFQANVTIFELIQDIIETNLLTKFHEDWTINVASRELTRQMLIVHDGQKVITKAHHEHVVLM
ncbi:hypothetical protein DPMN_072845 [Dreissena polymorpha]|uniref:Uncharacterized protein n=1 Tax=Dreissena polymorpha TaxID=45954 RepID=A0A9D4BY09_DREPO|nr:hypothetical protein DPMN_072845 [Dreissena polymorpha]